MEAQIHAQKVKMTTSTIHAQTIRWAAEGNVEFFKAVALYVIRKSKDGDGSSVLGVAARFGHLNCCEVIFRRCPELLYKTNNNQSTALHNAAFKGEDKIVQFLLTASAKLDHGVQAKLDHLTASGSANLDHLTDRAKLRHLKASAKQAMKEEFWAEVIEATTSHTAAQRIGHQSASNTLLRMVDCNKETALHLAVRNKNLKIVQLLVEADPHFEYAVNASGATPLFIALEAAFSGDQRTVEIRNFLIRRQPSQCAVQIGTNGWTILHHAASKGDLSAIKEILLSNSDCSELVDSKRQNFLHLATKNEHGSVVKYVLGLVSSNVLNGQDMNGNTALHVAVSCENLDIPSVLAKADPSKKLLKMVNGKKETAMDVAVRLGRLEIVKFLVGVLYSDNKFGDTPLYISWKKTLFGDKKAGEIKKFLIEKEPDQCRLPTGINQWSLIHHATHEGDLSTVKEIIHFWPDCCQLVDKEGQNFLHIAVKFNQAKVVKYILTLTKEVVGSVLRGRDINGNTALHVAVSCESLSIASVLAEADPSKNLLTMVNNGEETAMHIAVRLGRLEIVKFLVGVVYSANKFGDTPLYISWKKALLGDKKAGEIKKFLIEKEHDQCRLPTGINQWSLIHHATHEGDLSTVKEIIHFWPDCCQLVDKERQNFLHIAVKFNQAKVVEYILTLTKEVVGSVLHGRDINGNTALHVAVSCESLSIASVLAEADPSKKLLIMVNNGEETAMHIAVRLGRLEIVKFLVGVVYLANKFGDTPLYISWKKALLGDQKAGEIKKFLIEKEPDQCRLPTGINQWSLIHHATHEGDLSTVKEIIHFWPDCCQLVDKEEQNFLHIAVKFNQAKVVKYILTLTKEVVGSVLRGRDINGNTALHVAVSCESLSIASVLAEADPSKNLLTMVNNGEETAMDVAVRLGRLQIVKFLVGVVYSDNKFGDTPLYISWKEALLGDQKAGEIKKFLIEKEQDQCRLPTGINQWSLIHHATREGDLSTVKEIIHFWPDCCQLVDKEEQNFLHIAVKFNQAKVVEYILTLTKEVVGSVLHGRDINGNTALHVAVSCESLSIASVLAEADPSQNLLRMVNNDEETAMHIAVRLGRLEIVKFLVGVVYLANKFGDTPLYISWKKALLGDQKAGEIKKFLIEKQPDQCRLSTGINQWSLIHHATRVGDLSTVKEIIHFWPDCCQLVDKEEQNFLHIAVKFNQAKVVEYILTLTKEVAGSVLHGRDINGNTALHVAVSCENLCIASVLAEADPNKKLLRMVNEKKETAMDVAVRLGRLEIVKFLVGVVYSDNKFGDTPLYISWKEALGDQKAGEIKKFLIEKEPDQCRLPTGINQWSLIHHATHEGDLSTLKEIIHFWPDCCQLVDKEGQNFLHIAVKFNQAKVVEYILTLTKEVAGSILYGRDINGNTALHVAVSCENLGIATVLAEADPSKKLLRMVNSGKETAMHIAVSCQNLEIVKLLCRIDPDCVYSTSTFGGTPLLTAWLLALSCDQKAVEIRNLLLERKSDQFRVPTDINEWSLIHRATHKGDLNTVKAIIDFWPDCSIKWVNGEEQNFLHFAAKFNQVEVMKYALNVVAPNVLNGKDIYGNTPLHVAISCENQGITSVLQDDPRVDKMAKNMEGKKPKDVGTSVPFQCAIKGDVEFFKEIKLDVLRKLKDGVGDSIFCTATRRGHSNCCEVILKRCPELLYQTNNYGNSILHTEASKGKHESVKFLLCVRDKVEKQGREDRDVIIDYKLLMMVNKNNCTALHLAANHNHLEATKMLVEVDTTKELLKMKDNRNETAMHYAVRNHNLEMVKLLLKADPDFEYSVNNSGETPLLIALQESLSHDQTKVKLRTHLIEQQASQCMIRTGEKGWSLLHHATFKQDLSAIEEITQFCPDSLELVDVDGKNILHLAVDSKNENVVNYILGMPKISDSILNGKDNNGDTPLHLATGEGSVDIALPLLYHSRVRKMIQNKDGKSALEAIDFVYDRSRANVQGHYGLVDIKELKDRSDFDLLVGALISTVSFTAGITVPGGFFSDGPNRGNPLLYKKRTFEAFVVFNTLALALSLFAVFSHFCMRRLVSTRDIMYQLKVATISSIGAIFAMMIAFVMGSFAVLSISSRLAITVCGICCCFFGFSFYSLWMTRTQQRRGRRRRNQQPAVCSLL